MRARLAVLTALLLLVVFPSPLPATQLPEWMEHWEFGMNVEEDDGPDYFADLILPLYRDPGRERVLFTEPRIRYSDGDHVFNQGIGVRQLVGNRAWLLGANMFYDYQSDPAHYRIGWGVEALSSYAELRGNYYLGLSQKRLVEEVGATQVFEEAVDGLDVEIGTPVPYYSRVKLFGGFNWYNFKEFKNRYGWTLRTEYTPVPFLVIDGLVSDDTKGNVDWGMTVALRIPLGKNLESVRSPLRFDETAFPTSDVSDKLWVLVERHHEIVVEAERKTGGVSVEVTRNN